MAPYASIMSLTEELMSSTSAVNWALPVVVLLGDIVSNVGSTGEFRENIPRSTLYVGPK